MRKEAAAAARRRVIYTFKNEPPAPRKGRTRELLAARAGHERPTLPGAHGLPSLALPRHAVPELQTACDAVPQASWRVAVRFFPLPPQFLCAHFLVEHQDSEKASGGWMRAQWTAAPCLDLCPLRLMPLAPALPGGDPRPRNCCAAAGGGDRAQRRRGLARRRWHGATSASATA